MWQYGSRPGVEDVGLILSNWLDLSGQGEVGPDLVEPGCQLASRLILEADAMGVATTSKPRARAAVLASFRFTLLLLRSRG